MERKKRGCPAVTLLIRKPEEISVDIILALQVKSSWPESTEEGLPIETWLGRKVRRDLRLQPFYLVPKHAKEEGHFQGILNVTVNFFKDIKKVIDVMHKGSSKRSAVALGISRVIRLRRPKDESLVKRWNCKGHSGSRNIEYSA